MLMASRRNGKGRGGGGGEVIMESTYRDGEKKLGKNNS
jgi:hypothetical protein